MRFVRVIRVPACARVSRLSEPVFVPVPPGVFLPVPVPVSIDRYSFVPSAVRNRGKGSSGDGDGRSGKGSGGKGHGGKGRRGNGRGKGCASGLP